MFSHFSFVKFLIFVIFCPKDWNFGHKAMFSAFFTKIFKNKKLIKKMRKDSLDVKSVSVSCEGEVAVKIPTVDT